MIGAELLSALLLSSGAAPPPESAAVTARFAQLTIRESVIIRVPTRGRQAIAPIEWKEGKGPKCLPMSEVAGATAVEEDSVDIILRGGGRVRAEFEDECPALDYYNGFYIRPTEDRRICAGRDSIHARSGGECQIRRFRTLTPVEGKKK
ncbi:MULTISPECIES: hypothetical protein [Sphingomonas]|uniref:Uncharacterized protein n=1 Tax=Edaphosphingomonas fennica TaxID=114404 RepID=A0A2T4HZ47_9SPHN|nr:MULTISPECIES: hypothetical protein [Sphingomonas]AGH51093.1 hypothetical protein G432_16875 [Sphingomonas sp. MM-1]MDX3885847.1 hypothetical protein [Sphingomonas sp.]PTD21631.1 hypothetical protein CV103_10215 [Sphingomonas fennica]